MTNVIPTTEFQHKITKETQGAFLGSALEEVLLGDPNWYPIGDSQTSAPGPVVEGAPKTLGELTVEQLKAVAAERGVDLGKLKAKAKIIEAIENGPGLKTPNPHDLAPALADLSDEQLDEVVDFVELDLDEQATREQTIEALLQHPDQAAVIEAAQTVSAD